MLLHRKLLYAVCGLFVLSFPVSLLAQNGQQDAASGQTSSIVVASASNHSASAGATEETASGEPPDSPGTVRSQNENPPEHQSNSSSSTEPQKPQTQGAEAPPPGTPEVKQQRPVGTAAAETPMVSGTTAAQPAGFAVAPAKQHRVRTLVIKVGAIAGAAVALGTTMALTMATPSKPPGAH